ncbi:hypothetical protein FTX61_19240 [Nitriliruptoraceae bacterium ZYF776]|nr:hypothetical protein [Profundirhabdus halotolerans]
MRIDRKLGRSSLALAAALVLATGCQQEPEEDGTDEQAAVDVTGSEDDGDDVDGADDATAEDPTDDADDADGTEDDGLSPPTSAWPDPIPVDVVGRHDGGLSIEITEVRAEASSIDLAVRVTNGQTTVAVRLTETGTPTMLVDDLGNEYRIVAPPDDPFLDVETAEVLEGTLSFVGPLDPDATSLTLVLNPAQEEEDQTRERAIPYLAVEGIDLVGGEGAADDGAVDAEEPQDEADTDA